MPSYNKTIVMGNLTRDPDVRTTQAGTAVASFSLAVNRHYKNANGEELDETTFVDIESFGKQAEVIGKYCSKGGCLLIEGRLKLDQWQDKATGEKRSKLKVIADSFQFVGSKQQSSQEDKPSETSKTSTNNDEIPF